MPNPSESQMKQLCDLLTLGADGNVYKDRISELQTQLKLLEKRAREADELKTDIGRKFAVSEAQIKELGIRNNQLEQTI